MRKMRSVLANLHEKEKRMQHEERKEKSKQNTIEYNGRKGKSQCDVMCCKEGEERRDEGARVGSGVIDQYLMGGSAHDPCIYKSVHLCIYPFFSL